MTIDQQQLLDVSCSGAWMLADLGSSYRAGTPLQSVGDFQRGWNALLPSIVNTVGVVLPTDQGDGSLVEDSLYGPQTATAVTNFYQASAGLPPPLRAADVPSWFSTSYDDVFAMCPEEEPVVPDPPVPDPVVEETTVPEVIVPATIPAADPIVVIPPPVTTLPDLSITAPTTPGWGAIAAIGLGVAGLAGLGYYATRK